MKANKLESHQLYKKFDPSDFEFTTTADIEVIPDSLGQKRALESLEFGVGIQQEGYNLFVLGPQGVGKHTIASEFLKKAANHKPTPDEWVYVNNFPNPDKPKALRFPAGRASKFKQEMNHLVEDLRSGIPSAFEAEEYHARRQEIEDELKERLEKAFSELTNEAEEHNITLLRTPHGFALAPVKDGNVVRPGDFDKLDDNERQRIQQTISNLEERLNGILRQQPQWQREAREKIKSLNREVALFAAGHLIDDIKEKFSDIKGVEDYLKDVLDDVIENIDDFRGEEGGQSIGLPFQGAPSFQRYEVNVLVDHGETDGVPVVYENHPTYQNLVGRIENKAHLGALFTDFSLIKAGSLHRANGGYLILDARKLLSHPYAWEGLKLALFAKEIRIQSLERLLSLVSTATLEPFPIPMDIKVVLLGDRLLYYLLHELDHEFPELFKVAADFDDAIDWNKENISSYSQMIAKLINENQLRHLDAPAVARVIEHSARVLEDTEKLSSNILNVCDLLRESDYWAKEAGRTTVTSNDVQQAIDAQIRRSDRVRQRLYEQIRSGVHMIDTEGEKIAQVNGLAVMELANFAFAQPSRITATARMGEGEVVDIEREVELGGALHSKGVFILSSYLASKYAINHPLSLSASLVFEQSYGMVDGDSASMAELCVLLSALSKIPIKQSLAITGSVNQQGEAQPIGGVNEKIEGFFDVCQLTKPLTGEQGVIIPAANMKHLMLRKDVVAAVNEGMFSIYAVHNVDDAIELLTGVQAGERSENGLFPPNTCNGKVEEQLIEYAMIRENIAKQSDTKSSEPNT